VGNKNELKVGTGNNGQCGFADCDLGMLQNRSARERRRLMDDFTDCAVRLFLDTIMMVAYLERRKPEKGGQCR